MLRKMDRREVLRTSGAAGAGLAVGLGGLQIGRPREARAATPLRAAEAMFYDKLKDGRVRCGICPRRCIVSPGERGHCGSRENRDGTYYTLVYGSAAALNIDPIEKKPLFHFLPGSKALSFGTAGCNMDCRDCQNWEISQARPEDVDTHDLPPARAVELALRYDCEVIAYTYSEPVTFYEYMHDTAVAGRKNKLRSVMISNGYINGPPMEKVCRHLDAVKVDWKGVTEEFYKHYCGGTLQPVLNTMSRVKKLGKWLEIVYLVVPTVNDSAADIGKMARWVKRYLGADTPVHFSRFHPDYQLRNLPPTPYSTLRRCHEIAREQGLDFVYLGNVPGNDYQSTRCPKCNEVVVERRGFEVLATRLERGKCAKCGREIPGVWS